MDPAGWSRTALRTAARPDSIQLVSPSRREAPALPGQSSQPPCPGPAPSPRALLLALRSPGMLTPTSRISAPGAGLLPGGADQCPAGAARPGRALPRLLLPELRPGPGGLLRPRPPRLEPRPDQAAEACDLLPAPRLPPARLHLCGGAGTRPLFPAPRPAGAGAGWLSSCPPVGRGTRAFGLHGVVCGAPLLRSSVGCAYLPRETR